ncbi:hypothetical protein [Leminorella grimontii]|uniref:hypothetical protein n=1 Tax=Leminorella grimontii TaxID=82981 RepID=UPI00208BE80E|nr:hypothetical protein [Leminorella grimontii]GKX59025.1 hypothetical protein SOASR031_13400 [Leminorella grimontii]
MLHAVLNGKRYGTGVSRDGNLTAPQAGGAEDVLTSVIFSRLAYLPKDVFVHFLTLLMPEMGLSHGINDIEFWPSWWIKDRRVEPDVAILCGDKLLIVEAKRYDGIEMQSADQLARELVASKSSEFNFNKLILLCVGGFQSANSDVAKRLKMQVMEKLQHYPERDTVKTDCFHINCQSWKSFYHTLCGVLDSENSPQYARIVNDIHQALVWHEINIIDFIDFYTMKPISLSHDAIPALFTDYVDKDNLSVNSDDSSQLFLEGFLPYSTDEQSLISKLPERLMEFNYGA